MAQKETIGFIGIGVMGESMARHLLNNGYPLHIYTRTKEKATKLIEEGAIWEDSVKDLSQKADILITIIGTPEDVENVYFGEEGILVTVKEKDNIIDLKTIM